MNRHSGLTPKEVVRVLVKQGEYPETPLVIPLIFSLGAKAEEIAPADFFYNATKITNSLARMHSFLGGDGVVVHSNASLEAEAIGCKLDWSTFPPQVMRNSIKRLNEVKSIDIRKVARVTTTSDVINRFKGTLRDGSALVALLTAPWSLALELSGYMNPREIPRVDERLLELSSSAVLKIAQSFCQAGLDILILREDSLPLPSSREYELWESVLLPLSNVIRFHEALAVLLVRDTLENEQIEALFNTSINFLPCFRIASLYSLERIASRGAFGLGIPPYFLTEDIIKEASALLGSLSRNLVLITTDGEIPYDTDIARLPTMISALKRIPSCLG